MFEKDKRPSLKAKKIWNCTLIGIGTVSLLYYIACGISLRFTVSALWMWLVLGIYCVVKGTMVLIMTGKGLRPKKPFRIIATVYYVLVCIVLALFLLFEALVIKEAVTPPAGDLEYVIVLGAWVKGNEPGSALQRRIDKAARYLAENEGCKAILSGGQGRDEEISEAECMKRGLVLAGISEDRLILEERSTSTLENIVLSKELIPDGERKIGIVTSNYHIFRAKKFFSRAFGYEAQGIPADHDSLLWTPHYFAREFLAYAADLVGIADELSAIAHRPAISGK